MKNLIILLALTITMINIKGTDKKPKLVTVNCKDQKCYEIPKDVKLELKRLLDRKTK